MPQTALYSKVLVRRMCGVSTVYVQCLYSACMVHVRCIWTYVESVVYNVNHLQCKRVKVQLFKLIYEYMRDKHIELMSCLISLPERYRSLSFQEYFAKTIPISALNKEAGAMLWHQHLIHCGSHSLKSASLYVNGVPNLSTFYFNDILKCPTCLKTNLTKIFSKKSIHESVKRPYQGLFIDFFLW